MLKKLKLGFINPGGLPFQLALKAAVSAILLFLVGYHWLIFLLFILSAVYPYLRPHLNNGRFPYFFLILISVSLIILAKLPVSSYRLLSALIFGVLFFILLGVKNLIFICRQGLYYIVNASLLLGVFLSFFTADKSEWFVLKYLLAGAAVFLLLREFLNSFQPDSRNKPLVLLVSLILAFLAMEMIWAVALLPIGFLNSSALLLLFTLVLEDFAANYLSGNFDRVIILRNITVFVLIMLAIFAASSWSV